MSGWIKCSDEMPKEGEKVLISFRGCVRIAVCAQEDILTSVFVDERTGYGLPASAWQYLPSPLKD